LVLATQQQQQQLVALQGLRQAVMQGCGFWQTMLRSCKQLAAVATSIWRSQQLPLLPPTLQQSCRHSSSSSIQLVSGALRAPAALAG
jgi:hypothetical protein